MIPSPNRPTRAIINLQQIKDNVAFVKKSMPKPVKTLAVVKANAYGHGAVAVATALSPQVDGFCVSNLDEALELREAGISNPILILGVVLPDAVPLAIEHQLALTVASTEWLQLAQQLPVDLTGLHVHLKIDSGMGRIGLRHWSETNSLMLSLEQAGVIVDGIFTHFATADEPDTTYFDAQLDNFKTHLSYLDRVPELVHTSNSATALWQADTVFDAIRLGVVMYGHNPSGEALPLPEEIQPALSLHSSLVHVKTVPAGQKIGYGGTYQAGQEEIVGTVPIGYADGYIRDLQDFKVLVEGQVCPIVGRISMDQLTIRLPKSYPLGTEVVLIGQSGNQTITATDLANHCGTINYEMLCLISDRVPREYD